MDKITNEFKFQCQMTACCCTKMEIFLNPYDILQIAKKTKMTTTEVIENYVLFLKSKDTGFIRPIFKSARSSLCSFNNNKLCSIHDHRPLSCRLFPLARIGGEFYLQDAEFCQGLKVDYNMKLSEYLSEDEGEEYLKSADLYHKIMDDLKVSGSSIIENKYYYDLLNILLFDFDYFYNGEYIDLKSFEKSQLSFHLADKLIQTFNIEPDIDKKTLLENLYLEGDRFIAKNIKK